MSQKLIKMHNLHRHTYTRTRTLNKNKLALVVLKKVGTSRIFLHFVVVVA